VSIRHRPADAPTAAQKGAAGIKAKVWTAAEQAHHGDPEV
jgi:hypothetical protein